MNAIQLARKLSQDNEVRMKARTSRLEDKNFLAQWFLSKKHFRS
jgi:hypothetical protein